MPTTYDIDSTNSISGTLKVYTGDKVTIKEGGFIHAGTGGGLEVDTAGVSEVSVAVEGSLRSVSGSALSVNGVANSLYIGATGVVHSGGGSVYVGAIGTVINAGMLTSADSAAIAAGRSLFLYNTGTIRNDSVYIPGSLGGQAVRGGAMDDAVTNAGLIQGNVLLQAGNDIYDGRSGFVDGLIQMGSGNDRAYGGSGSERFNLGSGDDFVDGGGGYDTVVFDSNAGTGVYVNMANPADANNTQGKDTYVSIEALIGTNSADTFIGNADANTFTGGSGNDILNGGLGSDTVVYKSEAQVNLATGVATTAAEDADTLFNIENVVGGDGVDSFIGNSFANTLWGNGGNDILNGGAGNDVLYGGSGLDTFVFNSKPSSKSNKDLVKDWDYSTDTIRLENAIFKSLKSGKLSKSSFVLGSKAGDKNDYVGYDSKTGNLWYDSNGSKSGGQVIIANIGRKEKIYYNDIFVI